MSFRKMSTHDIRALREARASGTQLSVYMYATMIHYDRSKRHRREAKEHPSRFNMNAEEAARDLDMSADTFRKSLKQLTKKLFTARDGQRVPVLVGVSRGYSGHNAEYDDNVYADGQGHRLSIPKEELAGRIEPPKAGTITPPNQTQAEELAGRIEPNSRTVSAGKPDSLSRIAGQFEPPTKKEEEKKEEVLPAEGVSSVGTTGRTHAYPPAEATSNVDVAVGSGSVASGTHAATDLEGFITSVTGSGGASHE